MRGRPWPPALRWTAYVLVAIAFAITCAYLSHWQFSRNAERSAQLQLVTDNYDAVPIPLSRAITGTDDFDDALEWHPVEVTGTYLADQQLVARNRPHGGTSAFEVLTPLLLDDGRVLIIDRGWVPPAEKGEGTAPIPAPPAGEVTVIARLRPGEPLPSSGRGAPDGQVPTINLPLVANTTGATTITSAYATLVRDDPAPVQAPVALEPPTNDPGPYLSYAVQWILFAVMGFVFIGYIIRTELTHRREEREEADERVAAGEVLPAPVTKRPLFPRRLDRDMVDEDALLDEAERR